ncbi:MAG: glutathione S-transferase family protein [Pseudomonadales bacterium]|nr:glutathione S-transferase family protein [Pseudomonadales bacterium]
MTKNGRILYGAWVSPDMSVVAQMLYEADIDFVYERVSPFSAENRSEAHYARNSLGKIPSYKDSDGTTISESLSICRYLARTNSSAHDYYPCNEPSICARVDTLNDFITFSIGGPFFNWFVVGKHFPVAWKLKTDDESHIFALWSMMLVNGEVQRLLDAGEMTPFLLGANPSIADFQFFYILEHGRTFSSMLDDSSFDMRLNNPNLMAFYNAMAERPATKIVLEQREQEFDRNRKEYFEEMESGFGEMIQGTRPILEAMFGHDV